MYQIPAILVRIPLYYYAAAPSRIRILAVTHAARLCNCVCTQTALDVEQQLAPVCGDAGHPGSACMIIRAGADHPARPRNEARVEFNNSSPVYMRLQSSSSAIKDTYSSPTADALGMILNIVFLWNVGKTLICAH
jgi:hypothetical protein